jgi:hypothetical protein
MKRANDLKRSQRDREHARFEMDANQNSARSYYGWQRPVRHEDQEFGLQSLSVRIAADEVVPGSTAL